MQASQRHQEFRQVRDKQEFRQVRDKQEFRQVRDTKNSDKSETGKNSGKSEKARIQAGNLVLRRLIWYHGPVSQKYRILRYEKTRVFYD